MLNKCCKWSKMHVPTTIDALKFIGVITNVKQTVSESLLLSICVFKLKNMNWMFVHRVKDSWISPLFFWCGCSFFLWGRGGGWECLSHMLYVAIVFVWCSVAYLVLYSAMNSFIFYNISCYGRIIIFIIYHAMEELLFILLFFFLSVFFIKSII